MQNESNQPSRRDAIATTGLLAASTLASLPSAGVYAQDSQAVNIVLVGCGGRGTGAAANALATKQGPVKLIGMADVLKERLDSSFENINNRYKDQKDKLDVPADHKFIGFDGYKKAMDLLKPGDVVILATPPAFRWPMFQYAIEKNLNVFMEKPVAVDGPSCRKMFDLAKKADAKNLKVAVGLMCRHCDARGEMFKRIKDGAIGDLTLMRAYRMAGPTASAFSLKKPANTSELIYQIQRFHSFLWASGGGFSDFLIHNIDECCWFKDAWPVQAKASGGRHYRGDYVDQNFDSYSVEYTFGDGAKLFLEGRCITGCHQEFASYAHGTKGSAIISESGHAPSHARLFKTQTLQEKDLIWRFDRPEPDPYQLEWEHLMDAIRKDKKYNEAHRGTEASLATFLGRLAAHTGRVWTRDQALNHEHELAPMVDQLTLESAAPVVADADGKYPVPAPGKKTKREY